MASADFLARAFAGKLARDTAHVGLWQAVRIGAQAIWVVLIARLLGPQGYGAFVGAAGLATAVGGLSGLGLGLVMLQDVSRDPTLFDDRWRKAIVVGIASGGVLAVLFGLLASLVLGPVMSFAALAAIALSELLLFPIVSIAAFAFSSRHLLGVAAALPALMAACRVLAALAFWLTVPMKTLDTYVWFHAAATLLCAGGAWLGVRLRLRPRPAEFRLNRRDLEEGFGFSAVWMVGNALASLDKTLVLRLAGTEIAGLYAASYRFATVLALPVDALTMAAGPRLFRHGDGTERQPQLIRRLLLSTLLYATAAAMALWALAGVLPWLLGAKFLPAVQAVRWMALFVPSYGLRLLGSNILMAGNGKKLRVTIEAGGLGLLVLLAVAWLPRHGLLGAVAMIGATEALLAAATWIAIWLRRHQPPATNVRSRAR